MSAPTLGEGLAPPLGGSPAPQVEDKIMDIASFAKFMEEHIKVENKTGALGTSVTVAREKAKVSVTTEVDMSKRYMKVRRPGGWPRAMRGGSVSPAAIDAAFHSLRPAPSST